MKGAAGYWSKTDIITLDNWRQWIIYNTSIVIILVVKTWLPMTYVRSACAFVKASMASGYDDASMVRGWRLTAGIGRAVRTGWVTPPLQPGALCSNENTTCDHRLQATLPTDHWGIGAPCFCAVARVYFMYYTLLTCNNKNSSLDFLLIYKKPYNAKYYRWLKTTKCENNYLNNEWRI